MSQSITHLTTALADRYAIDRQIGQGGMATVYLAEDLKHHRKVAVKVLRPELAAVLGGDRFLKEIEVTANLQHPNILPLFDSGRTGRQADGRSDELLYYVMPYVEGESLRDRLDREKQLPVSDAVAIATEIAGALDYAHRHDVIHRDIKPENILLHDGRALVADFGIALAVTQAGGTRITETGLSLGTPDYMSPEQATADRDLDGRSDVYSLGAVTYEMLTGDPPHTGNTVQGIIAKIVSDPPAPISRTRSTVPSNVDAAVQTALAKSPADRFPTAARLAEALSDPSYSLPTAVVAGVPTATDWRHRVAGPLVLLAILLLVATLWGWLRQPTEEVLPVIRYTLALSDTERLIANDGPSMALSPDGARLVYVGPGGGGRQLWLRERDQLDGVPLPDTEDAWQPFFAPDGERVAFITRDGQLKVVPLTGSPPLTLVDSAIGRSGGSWGPDGDIYVTSAATRGLIRVAATGVSVPGPVTQVEPTLEERYHVWPDALPNGKGVLFTIYDDHLDNDVAVVDLSTGEYHVLVRGDLARYLPTGHLFYVLPDGAMLAVPFDQDQLQLTGPPVLLGEFPNLRGLNLAVSERGRMVWVREPPRLNQVVWVDRRGAETPIDPDDPMKGIRYVALSPDGRQLVVNTWPGRGDYGHLWIKQLPRGPLSRFTFEGGVNHRPSWTPDGRSVLFVSDRDDNRDVWIRLADGSAPAELVVDEDVVIDEASFSGDGEWLVYRRGKEEGQRDIYARRVGQDTVGRPLVNSEFDEVAPALSPDGRWLAFVSVESGEPNVYVRPFPSADAQWRVSTNGGMGPVWARDGAELFYTSGADEMIAVTVRPGSTFQHGEEQVLFSTGPYRTDFFHQAYDVAADGRFVMIRQYQTDTAEDELVVVENWFEEVKSRMANQ